MTDIVYHELYCEEIKRKLIGAGVIHEKPLTSKSEPNSNIYLYVLDYERCNSEKWDEDKAMLLEDGVVKFGIITNEEKSCIFSARRDYTPDEQAELGLYPVNFSDDGNKMTWMSGSFPNESVSVYASSALPNEVMILSESDDRDYSFGFYLKNGHILAHKPTTKLIGINGNIHKLTGVVSQALQKVNLFEQAKQMQKRVASCKSYEEALSVISEYVTVEAEENQ